MLQVEVDVRADTFINLLVRTTMTSEKKFSRKSVTSTERVFFDESFKTFRLYPGMCYNMCFEFL